MSRVIFDVQPGAPQINTLRADVACFVGLARVLAGATLPTAVVSWLQFLGFPPAQISTLTNVPIPIESFAAFTALFDDGASGKGFGTDYAAAAVRSYFAQGGKKCYIVRVADPVAKLDLALDKSAKLTALLGAIGSSASFAPDGPLAWTGVGALGALEDVSLLVMPDLPAVCASALVAAEGQAAVPPLGPQEFTPCVTGQVVPQQRRTFQTPAPRLIPADYQAWAANVATVLNYLAGGAVRHQLHLREIQFVAAFPLPQHLDPAAAAEHPSSDAIAQDIHDVLAARMPETPPPPAAVLPDNISSAFLQLGYPWLKTGGSGGLLEQLEPPDGALAGLIARNALSRGTFTSATKIVPAEIYDVSPALPAQETMSSATPLAWGTTPGTPQKALIERLSLFGMSPLGLRLLSDVTAYPGGAYRSGAVNRLVSVICRAARTMGEGALFQANGPALWGRVQRDLQNLMTRLWTLNALAGTTASDAFTVRCDRSTITQNDLDNGRLMAQVTFTAAATLETIRVQLAIEAGGTSTQEIAANLTSATTGLGNVSAGGTAGVI
jgi:hypothetical protein